MPKARARYAYGRFFTPPRTTQYEERIAWYARAERARVEAPLEVVVEAWSQRPLRCDLDNVLKAVLDGLVRGGAISDDSAAVVVAKSIRAVVGAEEKTVVHLRHRQAR